jgi:micrococcal nuclease
MLTLTRFVAAVLTAAVLPACSVIASSVAHADPVATTATVLKVVDGDTVDIVDDVRGRLRIRLLGIDTPETKKPGYTVGCWGPQASEFAKSTLLGQRVAFVTDPTQGMYDRYGRTLAYLDKADGWDYSVRSGPCGCCPFLRLSRPSLGPSLRDRRCRTGGKGRWSRTVGAAMLRRNDLNTRVIRRGSPRPQSPPAMRSAPTAQCRPLMPMARTETGS